MLKIKENFKNLLLNEGCKLGLEEEESSGKAYMTFFEALLDPIMLNVLFIEVYDDNDEITSQRVEFRVINDLTTNINLSLHEKINKINMSSNFSKFYIDREGVLNIKFVIEIKLLNSSNVTAEILLNNLLHFKKECLIFLKPSTKAKPLKYKKISDSLIKMH